MRSSFFSSLKYGFGIFTTLSLPYAFYNYGNYTNILDNEYGILQDLKTGEIKEEIIQPGKYFFPIFTYVKKYNNNYSINSSLKIKSKDKQIIPVEIELRGKINKTKLPLLSRKYIIEDYQDYQCNKIIKEESNNILGDYSLVEWLDKDNIIKEQLYYNIKEKLDTNHIICDDIHINYDLKYIRDIFYYFYTEDELRKQSFYPKLYKL